MSVFIFTPGKSISTQLFSRKIPRCSCSTSDMRLLDIFALQLLVGSSIALPSSRREDGNLEKRADSPFVGFDGCSPSQKNDIITAWGDAQKLATIPAEFNVAGSSEAILLPDPFVNVGFGCSGICKVGVLEQRFFGNTIGQDPAAAALVKTVFMNIRDLNGKKPQIRISCDDQENPALKPENRAKCSNTVNGLSIGGYAFGTSTELKDNTIVLCKTFFLPGQQFLSDIEKELRSSNQQTNALSMVGKGKILLHELTHLPAIVEKYPTDTYAWYASEMYFNSVFGVAADAYNRPRDGDPEPPPPDAVDSPTEPAQAEKWRMTLYDNVWGCKQDGNTKSREIWGSEVDKCYTFNSSCLL
ncbi:oviduct-specific glyco protein [Rutstroemia sp. NJR-2017a BVV2]|nr:oviduct-specific glyco protein [Rutstroemia sp. NJR-2017a BVV2]